MQKVETVKSPSGKVQEPASSTDLISGISHSSANDETGEQCSIPTSPTVIPAVSSFQPSSLSSERILDDQLSLFRNSGKLKGYNIMHKYSVYVFMCK